MSASAPDETAPALQGPVSSDSGTFRAAPTPNDSSEAEFDSHWPEISRHQLSKLSETIQRIHELHPLRRDAITSQIFCRKKMREVAFKRDDVSTCDSNLMRRLQTLVAQGKLEKQPDLLELFTKCQEARDILGPLEKEAIDAERTSEWKWYKVEKAEELAYISLFSLSENLPFAPSSSSIRGSESESEHDDFEIEDEIVENLADSEDQQKQLYPSSALSQITDPRSPTRDIELYENTLSEFSLDSEMVLVNSGEDSTPKSTQNGGQSYYSNSQSPSVIDNGLESRPDGYMIPEYPTNKSSITNLDFNPRLLLDFTTIRERVNNWLLHHVLLSRLEAEFLKLRLDAENPKAPSNWAQLVIAWWSKDAAANPSYKQPVTAKECFVMLLFDHEKLHSLFEEIRKSSLTREEFFKALKMPLHPFLANLIIESKTSSEKEIATYVANNHNEVARLMEIAVYGPRPESTEQSSTAPAVDEPTPHLIREWFLRDSKVSTESATVTSQPEPCLNVDDDPNLYELPESFKEFVLQSDAFRNFYDAFCNFRDACIEDCNIQEKRPLLETNNRLTPIPQKEATPLCFHELPSLQISQLETAPFNVPTEATAKKANSQVENNTVSLDQDNYLNAGESEVIQKEPERKSPPNSVQSAKTVEPEQANSSRKRQPDASTVQLEQAPFRVQNSEKAQNQSYSDALNQGLSSSKRPQGRKSVAPLGSRPQAVSRPRSDPLQKDQRGDIDDGTNGAKTPTPASVQPAKLGALQESSRRGFSSTTHSVQVASEPGQRVYSLRGERNDKDYKRFEKHHFIWGKVFKVQWTEPENSNGEHEKVISSQLGQYTDDLKPKPRHFIIIDKQEDHCKCLAIMTYGGRGTAKAGVNANDHAIIYMKTPRLMEGERNLKNPPIRVMPLSPGHKLQEASRLNYSKIYRIGFDVKICFIGKVDPNSERVFKESCRIARLPIQTQTKAMPPLPPLPVPFTMGTTWAQVAARSSGSLGRPPGSPTTTQSSSFSSSSFGRAPRSQSTQSSVFPMAPSAPQDLARKSTFTMSPQTKPWIKGRFSTSPTRISETKNPQTGHSGKDQI